jgi:hypothetical protein
MRKRGPEKLLRRIDLSVGARAVASEVVHVIKNSFSMNWRKQK